MEMLSQTGMLLNDNMCIRIRNMLHGVEAVSPFKTLVVPGLSFSAPALSSLHYIQYCNNQPLRVPTLSIIRAERARHECST